MLDCKSRALSMAPPAGRSVRFLHLSPRWLGEARRPDAATGRPGRRAPLQWCEVQGCDAGGLARVLAPPHLRVKAVRQTAAWDLTRVMAPRIEAAGVEALDLVAA